MPKAGSVTTLRHYAHARPLDDQDLDEILNRATPFAR